jgi:hypothetical protein
MLEGLDIPINHWQYPYLFMSS